MSSLSNCQTRHRITLVDSRLSKQHRRAGLVTMLLPFAGTLAAAVWTWQYGVAAATLWIAACLYLLTLTGLTVGFHRLFTHRSFQAKEGTKAVLAILGMMAAQGPLLFWVAAHRRHHAYSDEQEDCHSPCTHGDDFRGRLRGLWHAHVGWMLKGEITNVAFAKDILRDDLLVFLSRHYLVWVSLGVALPGAAGWLSAGLPGAIEGVLWGGFVRIFLVHHVTWALNSLNHVFGTRRYRSSDNSRNIAWLALLSLGEGWHNNHHACPASARFGHKWWEIDVGYAVIRLLHLLGQCKGIRPPDEQILADRLQ